MTETKVCTWSEDDEGTWLTDCRQEFVFIDGGPKDNGLKFCCYCGKILAEEKVMT